MTNEHAGFSRRKLLKAGAIGVPAAGVLAFGSTLVTATSANAISTDGWWGSETSLATKIHERHHDRNLERRIWEHEQDPYSC